MQGRFSIRPKTQILRQTPIRHSEYFDAIAYQAHWQWRRSLITKDTKKGAFW
jgi:hypothetical protein